MANTTKRSSIDPTPLFAVVGVTDLAVERVRAAVAGASAVQHGVEKRVTEFDPKALQAEALDVPNKAAAFALTTASKASTRAEATYDDLAKRGKSLVDRIRSQRATQDLLSQAGNTVSRGRAAVTVARKAADDTTSAILGTLSVGRREAEAAVESTQVTAQTAAKSAVKRTRTAARKTTTTVQKDATATKTAVKSARTSAKKTAAKTTAATRAAAKKVGK